MISNFKAVDSTGQMGPALIYIMQRVTLRISSFNIALYCSVDCTCHPLFFRPVGAPGLAFQFTINVPLVCPPFSTFRKICIYSLVFWPKFQLSRGKILNFRSQDPSFVKENPLPRPYFTITWGKRTFYT